MRMTSMIRSVLFVPGNRPERIEKAIATAADAVIVDLEDAVPMVEKLVARSLVTESLRRYRDRKLWVRVNGPDTEWIHDDIEAVIAAGIGGIMVPKLETANQVDLLFKHIAQHAENIKIDPKEIIFILLVETALSVENAYSIAVSAAGHSHQAMLAFGAADFTTDLGINLTDSGDELMYSRARIAIASRAAGVLRPLDTPYMIDIKDRDGLKKDADRARNLGFQGKLCIHPAQVDVVNNIFSPTPTEIDFAKRVLSAYEMAVKEGKGAVQLDGKFIDPPVVERAKQILEWKKR